MKCPALIRFAPFACAISAVALAQTAAVPPPPMPTVPAAATPAKKEERSQWVFSLLPKSFQKNPQLDLTVITEMTELGKKLPPVSPEKPAYFVAVSSGYHPMGDTSANEHTLK